MEDTKNLDINALLDMLPDDDEPIEGDPERSAFEAPPPVPDDTYVARLGLMPNATASFEVNGKTYVNFKLMARIINEGHRTNNNVVFQMENDMPGRDGKLSRIASILKELGYKAGVDYRTKPEARKLLVGALASEPICKIRTRLELSVDTGLVDPNSGKKIYGMVFRGMTKFPKNPDGSYNFSPVGVFSAKYWDKATKTSKSIDVELDGSKMAQPTIASYEAVS
jgi:hypothetical protein